MSFGGWLLRAPLGRLVAALGGLGAMGLGAILLQRPLTALVVLLWGVGCALLVAAGSFVWRARSKNKVVALPAAGLGIAVLVWLPAAAAAVAVAVAVLLLATAAWLCVRAMRRGGARPWKARGADLGNALAAILGAGLALAWPDATSLLLGFGCAVALIGAGAVLVWVVLRSSLRARSTAGTASPTPGPHSVKRRTGGLRVVGAALLLCVMIAATWGSVVLRSGVAKPDAFYDWQGEIPANPGEVLRAEPYTGQVPAGATAVRVLYTTTHGDGSPALASAVIAYPSDTRTDREVLAWQHGTTGVAQSCGPSVGDEALTEYAIPGISRAIERGWVVVATDYPGQGTAGRYPYLVGEGEGRATLDGIRAARHLEAAGASHRAWVWGHSQGGHATLWAGEIAMDYAPELELQGVAALSAAADPLAMAEKITSAGAGPLADVVTAFVVLPYSEEYPEVALADTVHPAGQGIVRAFADRCVTAGPTLVSVLAAAAIGSQDGLYRLDLAAGPVHDVLSRNIASGRVPAPLFLGQGVDDEVVPIGIQRSLHAAVCALDRPVETHEYPGATHMGVIAEGAPLIDDLYAWADRVAAGEQPSSCAK